MRIPLSSPDVTEAEVQTVAEVLRSSQLSLGPKLLEFEAALAAYVGVQHGIAVSSGTAGLHLCIRALGLSEGDEVIVPSFTFIAVANAVRYERALPVFVDIDAASLNMSPGSIEQAITRKTRAIIVVHTFGRPAEMERILAIAKEHKLFVIEDACEALGAESGGQRVGTFGDLAVLAFYPNKQITTGEGGAVLTRRTELAERIRMLRNQGRGPGTGWFQHDELGYNYRLSEPSCALGVGQMRRVEEILKRREQIARLYDKHLRGQAGLIVPEVDVRGSRISWFVYVVRLEASYTSADRDSVIGWLEDAGIGCGRYFAPVHLQPAYSACCDNRSLLTVTEMEACRTIALPFFNRMTEDQVVEVCSRLGDSLVRLEHMKSA